MLSFKKWVLLATLLWAAGCGDPDPSKTNNMTDMGADMQSGAPIARLTPNSMVQVGEEVRVSGADSSDPNGDVITPKWKVTLPAESKLQIDTDTMAFAITFTPDVPGDYVFELVVNDGTQDSEPARSTIRATGDALNRKPIANAGADQTVPQGQQIVLDGSGSSDPDGDTLSYTWSIFEAPMGSAATLDADNVTKTSFTPDLAGTYRFQLVVNDGAADSDPDIVIVSVLPENSNTPPVADAGLNKTGVINTGITLDGSGSSDADGDALTYAWTILDGPMGAGAMLSMSEGVMVDFTTDTAGTYTVQLVVNDGEEDSAPDTVLIEVSDGMNTAPVANAGPDRRAQLGMPVSLDGSGSMDADGDMLTYSWVITAKPAGSVALLSGGSSATPTLTPDREGEYVIELRVNDGQETSAPDSVKVIAGATAPECVIISEYVEGSANNKAVELFNCGSVPMDLSKVGLCLIANTGTTCSKTSVFTGMLATGEVFGVCHGSFALSVDPGDCDATSSAVEFNGDDRLLVFHDLDGDGAFDASQDIVLDAFGQPDMPPSSRLWENTTYRRCDFTPYDGSSAFDVSVFYQSAGIDDVSDFGTPPTMGCMMSTNRPPVAVAGTDRTETLGAMVMLDGSASSDPDGDALTYQWSLMTPNGSAATLNSAAASQPVFTPDVPGTYVATLVTNDGTVDSAPDSITITVVAPQACLRISELAEGSASNKVVEVFNCGMMPVDLSKYGVCTASNADMTCTASAQMSGMLAPGAVYGVCNGSLTAMHDAADCDQSVNSITSFNGDDRVAIYYDADTSGGYTAADLIVDAFGTIATQPSSTVWANTTYRRCNVDAYDGTGPFQAEWYYTTAAQDDLSTFGDAPVAPCLTNHGPVASAGGDRSVVTGTMVALDGSGSSDADNDTLSYQWTLVAPMGSAAALSDATVAQPSFTADVDGTYTLTLVVHDGNVFSPEVSVTITAQQAGSECLIISEYIEGSSNNKAFELFNCGTSDTTAGTFGVCLRSNTSTSGCTNTLILNDVIASGTVYGVCNSGINTSLIDAGDCNTLNSVANYNGNDRLFVFKDADGNGVFDEGSDPVVDAFGLLGTADTSNSWKDMTLQRCSLMPFDGTGTFDFNTFYNKSAMVDDFSNFGDAPSANPMCTGNP